MLAGESARAFDKAVSHLKEGSSAKRISERKQYSRSRITIRIEWAPEARQFLTRAVVLSPMPPPYWQAQTTAMEANSCSEVLEATRSLFAPNRKHTLRRTHIH